MIVLIRHCHPEIDYSRCGYIEAISRVQQYNTTKNVNLKELELYAESLETLTKEKNLKVFSSSLSRSLITARAIFGSKFDIDVKDLFVEFDLKILPIPLVKLKFKTWLLISRIIWFFGLLKTSRSFAQERLRAKQCAEILHNNTQGNTSNQKVVLVSHGLLNAFIERYLKTKGYTRVEKMKNTCFSITYLQS
jgi:broad specificity phosphatase PhoE